MASWTLYEDTGLNVVTDEVTAATASGRVFVDPFSSTRVRCDHLLRRAYAGMDGRVCVWRLNAVEWRPQWSGEFESVPSTAAGSAPLPGTLWDWTSWLLRFPVVSGVGWDVVAAAYMQLADSVVEEAGRGVKKRCRRFWQARVDVLERVVMAEVPQEYDRRAQHLWWTVPLDALARWLIVSDTVRQPWFPDRLSAACDDACDPAGDIDDGPLYVADVIGGGTEER